MNKLRKKIILIEQREPARQAHNALRIVLFRKGLESRDVVRPEEQGQGCVRQGVVRVEHVVPPALALRDGGGLDGVRELLERGDQRRASCCLDRYITNDTQR